MNGLRIGDLLYRTKGVVEHAGVYLGSNCVLHTAPTTGIEIVSLERYGDGQEIKFKRIEATDMALLASRLSHILAGDRRFDLLGRNCEQVAHFLISGRNSSPQLLAAITGGAFGGLVACQTRSENWLMIVLAFSFAGCALSNLLRSYDGTISAQQPIHAAI
tara:strand:- start:121024 stop:121506 length:483 start_codon:yes stop_codon:yes gene_type:complete